MNKKPTALEVNIDAATTNVQKKNFLEITEGNVCANCSAPCCRVLIVPHATPLTFMDLDYIRYIVGFNTVQLILKRDGSWRLLMDQICRLLDQKTNLCTVHDTPRQPKTCVFFNPHECWYRANFENNERTPNFIRIDMDKLEALLPHIRFDEHGNILEIPTWEFIRDL